MHLLGGIISNFLLEYVVFLIKCFFFPPRGLEGGAARRRACGGGTACTWAVRGASRVEVRLHHEPLRPPWGPGGRGGIRKTTYFTRKTTYSNRKFDIINPNKSLI